MFTAILNYNEDEKAKALSRQLPGSVIVDSSGEFKPEFVTSLTPYYTGNFNKACQLFLLSGEERCLIVCADVIGDFKEIARKIKSLPDDVGIYTPSVYGKSFNYLKPVGTGLRDILFAEGMVLSLSRKIVAQMHPIRYNTYGWGVDIYAGYVCKCFGLRCVVDNDISVFHPYGKAYSGKSAKADMNRYIDHMGLDFKRFCRATKIGLPLIPRMIMRAKNLLTLKY